jgi:hypothetical protein
MAQLDFGQISTSCGVRVTKRLWRKYLNSADSEPVLKIDTELSGYGVYWPHDRAVISVTVDEKAVIN